MFERRNFPGLPLYGVDSAVRLGETISDKTILDSNGDPLYFVTNVRIPQENDRDFEHHSNSMMVYRHFVRRGVLAAPEVEATANNGEVLPDCVAFYLRDESLRKLYYASEAKVHEQMGNQNLYGYSWRGDAVRLAGYDEVAAIVDEVLECEEFAPLMSLRNRVAGDLGVTASKVVDDLESFGYDTGL